MCNVVDPLGDLIKETAVIAAVINTVNCSKAPNCLVLNRQPCSLVQFTCGVCLSGYIGQSGHANIPCIVDPATSDRVNWSNSDTTGMVCSTDSQCNGDRWEGCVEGICAIRSKACSNDCSDRGHCTFRSTFNSSILLTACRAIDFNCEAVCDCVDGFSGRDCYTSSEDFAALLQLRHKLVETVREISQIAEFTRENIVSWLDNLAGIAVDSTGLLSETKRLAATIVSDCLQRAKSLGLSHEEISSTGAVLDLVLPGLSEEDQSASKQLLQLFGDYIASDMLTGQNPVTVVSTHFRLSSLSVYNVMDDVLLSSPTTSLESLLNRQMHCAKVPTCGALEPFKLVVTENSLSSADNKSSLSSGFGVGFGSNFVNRDCPITITMQYASPLTDEPDLATNETVSFQCSADTIVEHEYTCANGAIIQQYCNGTIEGVVTRVCPIFHTAAACASLGNAYSSCVMVNFTQTNVTCECLLPYSNVRRLQSEDDQESVNIEYIAVGQNLAIEFGSTWKSADELTVDDVAKSWRVLATVASIGIASVLLMGIGWQADKRAFHSHSIDKDSVDKKEELPYRRSKLTSTSFTTLGSFFNGKLAGLQRMGSGASFSRARTNLKTSPMSTSQLTVDEALPTVLKPLPVWKKFVIEAQVYHRSDYTITPDIFSCHNSLTNMCC